MLAQAGGVRFQEMLVHTETIEKDDYHYFNTDRSVTVQIGRSTNRGLYSWGIYHPDFKCVLYGGEADSIESAKIEAAEWIEQWVEKT